MLEHVRRERIPSLYQMCYPNSYNNSNNNINIIVALQLLINKKIIKNWIIIIIIITIIINIIIWRAALLEKTPVVHLLNNFPKSYWAQSLISVFTRALNSILP
jgi:hypothetical protein